MKRIGITLLLAFAFIFTTNIQAQEYKSAVGAKLGWGLVGTYKMFLTEKTAVDVFGGFHWNGLGAGAFYLWHYEIESIDKLYWYWGLGGSITTRSYLLGGNYFDIGVSGVIGLDYSFDEIPVNLSVDWAPTIVVFSTRDSTGRFNRFRGDYGALSVRYILGR